MKNTLAVSLLLVLAWIPLSQSLKKPLIGARKEDVPYIKCQVCEKLGAQLYDLVEKRQDKIMKEKESRKTDWKQKITEGITKTSHALKKHANRLRQWWKAKTERSKKKTSKSEF